MHNNVFFYFEKAVLLLIKGAVTYCFTKRAVTTKPNPLLVSGYIRVMGILINSLSCT